MADLGNLPDNKLMSLALHGYNPFQPDVGIFCGGYQGPLYPNPTTLSYPGFDPYLYTDFTASTYQMDGSYSGLGIGNPGIDYKNPGHILGLLDTFARMSYGIGVLQAIHSGDVSLEDIGPAVGLSIPMLGITEEANDTLGISDIYPSLSEVPTDWIDGFDISSIGVVSPDPRSFVAFPTPGFGYTPSTSPIDEVALNNLFANKTIFSYIGMPQYFRTVINSLTVAANNLNSKIEHDFVLINTSGEPRAEYFNRYSHQGSFFEEPPDEHYERTSEGKAYAQCIVHESGQVLKILTGSTDYHNGVDGQNEYRSLTELNSVINIIPLQMVGATYWTDTKGYRFVTPPGIYEIDDQTGRSFMVAAYMIADFVINVSDIPPDPNSPTPGTITIEGDATVHSLITDPTQYYYTETRRLVPIPITEPPGSLIQTEFGCAQSIRKNVDIAMSMTTQLAWDQSWLGSSLVEGTESFTDVVDLVTETGGSRSRDASVEDSEWMGSFVTLNQDDLITSFSKTFTLGAGCTSIRMRVFLRNRHSLDQGAYTSEDLWVPVEFCHEHDFVLVRPGFHCHYPAGVIGNGWANNPDIVPDFLASPNMELSFTVTGTNINSFTCNVSI